MGLGDGGMVVDVVGKELGTAQPQRPWQQTLLSSSLFHHPLTVDQSVIMGKEEGFQNNNEKDFKIRA